MVWLNLYIASVIASAGVKGIRDFTSTERIKRKLKKEGKSLVEERNAAEAILSSLGDYSFAFMPFYNIYRLCKIASEDKRSYDANRLSELEYNGRISSPKEEKKEKPEVKKEEKPVVKKAEPVAKKTSIPVKTVDALHIDVDTASISDMECALADLFDRDKKLRHEWNLASDACKKNEICNRIVAVDNKIRSIQASINEYNKNNGVMRREK